MLCAKGPEQPEQSSKYFTGARKVAAGLGRQAVDLCHHVIKSAPVGAGHLLAAVGPINSSGHVAVYFKSGFAREDLVKTADFDIHSVRSIGNGFQVIGTPRAPAKTVRLPVVNTLAAKLSAPQTDQYQGLNVGLALRHAEPPEQVVEWLRFHAKTHGMQAALIVDRCARGKPSELVKLLRKNQVPGIERVGLVSFDLPLGHADMGDERLAFYAPDAPGKDRMEKPDPDSWRAPFSEVVIYEMLRHLFLDQARAVMNVDVSDLVPKISEGNLFDLAMMTRGGVVALMGDRVYPWGLKKGAKATFGDHICRRFDAPAANPRWCVAPEKTPDTTVWRLTRVVGTQAKPKLVYPYLRCMALRHPEQKLSTIVPKTSLVEDPRLLGLMQREFDAEPRRAPKEKLKPGAKKLTNRSGIVTCMKNEGPFILEWLAYHKAIGVEDFLVYTNDCTDGTDRLLDLLQAKGLVQHRDNPYKSMDMKPQHGALHAATEEPLVKALDWLICIDVDEFINIHVGEGTLSDLYAATDGANMISMTWRLFGNGDVEQFRDGFIIEEYIRCAPPLTRKPHQAWGFKTAIRNTGIFKKLGVHRPKGLRPQLVDEIRWVNGSGKPMPERDYRNAWRSTVDTYGYDLVTLNHYALRSAESFLVKRDRGRVNHVNRDQGLNYWFRMNHNAQEDRSIQRMIPAVRAEFAKLIGDPEIEAMHRECVAAHRAKVGELKATDKYTEFYNEITSKRMRGLSRMLECFGSKVFLNGPDVIPDSVLEHANEPGFFFTVVDVEEVK